MFVARGIGTGVGFIPAFMMTVRDPNSVPSGLQKRHSLPYPLISFSQDTTKFTGTFIVK